MAYKTNVYCVIAEQNLKNVFFFCVDSEIDILRPICDYSINFLSIYRHIIM